MRLTSPDHPDAGDLLHALAMAGAVVLAACFSLALGIILSYSPDVDTAGAVAAACVCGVALMCMQIGLQAWLVHRSATMQAAARYTKGEAAYRKRQLDLITQLTDVLDREVRRRRIISRAIDFFAEELHATSVVYWKPDADREPAVPYLARSSADAPRQTGLRAAHRAVVARQSYRSMRTVYLEGPKRHPQAVDHLYPPPAPLHLFVPLPGSDGCEGLLELTVPAPGWDAPTWSVIELLAARVGTGIERGRRYEELQQQADLDYVTGVFSHRFMQNYLQRVLLASQQRRRPVGVLLLDVDGFKTFNDTLGHGAGDRVLQIVASELKRITGKSGIVGRCGGDEFMVVLPDQGRAEAEVFKESLRDWLQGKSTIMDGGLRISVSCGAATYPEDADNRQELLALADARLYRAKAAGAGARGRSPSRAERTTTGVYGVLDRILDTIQERDSFTREHSETTAEYAVALAHELGLSTAAQRTLRLAGLLHDIGKIGLPAGLMDRAMPVGDESAAVEHQLALADHLIADVPNAEEVRRLVRDHHERWDGGGYPHGLRGEAIPYLARVLAVADSYSVITVRRSELSRQEAYKRLQKEAGKRLDPEIVRLFGRALSRPTGESEIEQAEAAAP